MNALMLYLIHASALGIGVLALRHLRRAGPTADAGGRLLPFGVALALVTFAVSEPQKWPFQDFVDAYYAGGKAALEGRDQVVGLLAQGVHGFVNVPVLAYLFAPLATLPPEIATALFFLLGAASMVAAFVLMVRLAGLTTIGAVALGLMFALNGPLMNSLREGNTTHFALLTVTLALLLLRRGSEALAGIVLGVTALLKPHLLLLGVYFLLRRRFICVASGALVIAGVGAVSVLLFGWDVHVLWYQNAVAKAGKEPVAAFNVQSMAALVARLEQGSNALLDWQGQPLSASGAVLVYAITALLFAAVVGTCATASAPPAGTEWEYMLVLVLACITSPLAWSHYYALMLLPYAWLLGSGRVLEHGPPALRWALYASIMCVSLPVVFPPEGVVTGGAVAWTYLLASSHHLYGGVLLLAVLIHVRVTAPAGIESSPRAALGGAAR